MAHEILISKFNETATMSFSGERTRKRNEILANMSALISHGGIHHIEDLIKGSTIGETIFCLVLIHEKTQDHKKSYVGPCITSSIFAFLLKCINHKSNYIQEIARHTLLVLATQKKYSNPQKDRLKEVIYCYDAKHDSDSNKRITWKCDVLLALSEPDKDSLLGCVVGKCVADSLGFIVEGYGPDVCSDFVDKFVRTELVPSWIRCEDLTFGQYSDDSQLARELLQAYLEGKGTLDAGVYAKKIAAMFEPGNYRIVGYSKTCAEASAAIWEGKSHKESGCVKGHGNGSAMRSAPIGILFAGCSDDDLIHAAKCLSSVTHARPRCMAGAAAIALATKFCMATKNIEFSLTDFVRFVARTGDDQLDSAIQMMPTFLKWSAQDVCKYVVDLGVSDGESTWDGISAGVTQTVLWSLYSVCKHPNSFVDCIGEAICVGGDVDTTGAIVGGIIGSRLGYDAIPHVWKNKIHDLDEWDLNDMCALVDDCFTVLQTNQTSLVY
jgi:ADP-ribosylglycohydrolase